MQNITASQETVTFAPLRPEWSRRWPAENLDLLEDVTVRLRVIPVFLPDPNNLGSILTDLHVYLGRTDLTSSFLHVLRANIDDGDVDNRRAQYQAAADRYKAFWEEALDGIFDVEAQRTAAAGFINAVPLSAALPRFGDGAVAGGLFGIWCFLYSDVAVNPVSLAEVLAHYNGVNRTSFEVQDLSRFDLCFSPGESPLRNPGGTSTAGGGGAIEVQLTSIYHNPNDDDIAAIQNELIFITAMVEGIETALMPGGPIMSSLEAAEEAIRELVVDVGSAQASVDSLADQVEDLITRIGT